MAYRDTWLTDAERAELIAIYGSRLAVLPPRLVASTLRSIRSRGDREAAADRATERAQEAARYDLR